MLSAEKDGEGEGAASSNGLLGSAAAWWGSETVEALELVDLEVDVLEMYPATQRGEALERNTSDGPRVADMLACLLLAFFAVFCCCFFCFYSFFGFWGSLFPFFGS